MTHLTPSSQWHVVILAGDRGPDDPVARQTGASCKALVDVNGQALLARVLDTLSRCGELKSSAIIGPDTKIMEANSQLAALIADSRAQWIAPAATPVASVLKALDLAPDDRPVLIVTADHVLLTPAMVTAMCQADSDLDLGVGLVDHARIHSAYPHTRRTATRLGRHAYCGCNLFAVYRPAGRRLIERWRAVEQQRKHPARLVSGMLGWFALLRYGLRLLSLESAFRGLSRRHGLKVGPVMLDDPRAAIDVDSPADLEQVEYILQERQPGQSRNR